MRATKTKTLDRPVPPQELFAAALTVVERGKYTIASSDEDAMRIGFVSGKTAISWGQEYVVEVTPSGSGSTMTVLCGSHDDAPKALMDGWKGGKAANTFIAAVEASLDARR